MMTLDDHVLKFQYNQYKALSCQPVYNMGKIRISKIFLSIVQENIILRLP